MTQALLLALAAVCCTALPASARAADVAFFPAETSNLAPNDAIAVGELLAQSYAGVSRLAVLSPTRTQDAVAKAPTYEAAAQSLGVREYVRTSSLAVGTLIVITATRYEANGAPIFQSKMTARSLEDVPAVTDRLAKALYHRVHDEEVRTRHNVTLTEARVAPRRASEKVIGVKTGFHIPFAKNADYSPHLSLQFDMRFEMERFFLEFGAGAIVPTSTDHDDYSYSCSYDGYGNETCTDSSRKDRDGHMGGLTAELGGSVFLTDGDVAPYIGFGLIPRLLFASDYDIASMSGYAQLGLMFPRDSSTRFYVDVRATQAVIEQHLDNKRGVYPTELTLHLGVGW